MHRDRTTRPRILERDAVWLVGPGTRGDIAVHRDRFDVESGEAHYRKALALAQPRGMRPQVAHC